MVMFDPLLGSGNELLMGSWPVRIRAARIRHIEAVFAVKFALRGYSCASLSVSVIASKRLVAGSNGMGRSVAARVVWI